MFPRLNAETEAGGAAMGRFLEEARPTSRAKAGHPRPARRLPGDAADSVNRHATARKAEGHTGDVAAREHQDGG